MVATHWSLALERAKHLLLNRIRSEIEQVKNFYSIYIFHYSLTFQKFCTFSQNANYVEGSSGLGVDKENAISPKKLHSGEATGKDTPFPYKRRNEFLVDGLPEIPFRKPSGYGVGQLRKIIQSRDNIKIRVKEAEPTGVNLAETSQGLNSCPPRPASSLDPLTLSSSDVPPSSSSLLTCSLVPAVSSVPSLTSSNVTYSTFSSNTPSSSCGPSSFNYISPSSSATSTTTFHLSSHSTSFPSSSSLCTCSPLLESSSTISSLAYMSSTSSSSSPLTNPMFLSEPVPSVQQSIPNQLSSMHPVSSTAVAPAVASGLSEGAKRRRLRRPGQKPRELPVYPFWSKVKVRNQEQHIIAEGMIVPGFQTENAVVSTDFRRKIYVMKVLDDVEGSSLEEGTYIIRPFNLLLPEVGITPGVGGLVDLHIQRNGRKLKLDEDQEELCDANSCQAPQGHNSQAPNAELRRVQCDSPKCRKWFHLQCVGVDDAVELPRKWFCGCSKFERENIVRYNRNLTLIDGFIAGF
ncbi:Hypothetical predicted protein [Paramuricea clavata]|uniref:Uncharacterized protein n=1 Tax=Paramuricea clavata TaxID=317549 RepID=A0A7D9DDE2_PARCT|nr:Hypothetical predicted protein [Paramuricea clavata]